VLQAIKNYPGTINSGSAKGLENGAMEQWGNKSTRAGERPENGASLK
jgi:hypothetical protein